MITILKDPSPVPAMLRQGQCWKLGNKVAEITACSLDLVHVTTWKPITCIHMEDSDNYLHAQSVFPYELGSIILALILSSHFEYNTHIHTDSNSSMEALLKPRKRVDSAREYYPLIATGKSLLRSTGTTLHKIAAHPERSEPNHHHWDRHRPVGQATSLRTAWQATTPSTLCPAVRPQLASGCVMLAAC